ncbi:MAG: LAGLIDADG family homing endonuclease [Nitrososphaerota archaeon]
MLREAEIDVSRSTVRNWFYKSFPERVGRRGEYRIEVKVKDMDFVKEFAECLGRVLRRGPPRPKTVEDGRLKMRVSSKALYELLQKPLNLDRIRPFTEYSNDGMRSFLRGFFDSEAHVDKKDGDIFCYNTDIRLLKYVQRLLKLLGIQTTGPKICIRKGAPIDKNRGEIYKKRKNVYYIYVKARDRLRFYKLVGFTIKRKQQRLEEYLRRRGLLGDSH